MTDPKITDNIGRAPPWPNGSSSKADIVQKSNSLKTHDVKPGIARIQALLAASVQHTTDQAKRSSMDDSPYHDSLQDVPYASSATQGSLSYAAQYDGRARSNEYSDFQWPLPRPNYYTKPSNSSISVVSTIDHDRDSNNSISLETLQQMQQETEQSNGRNGAVSPVSSAANYSQNVLGQLSEMSLARSNCHPLPETPFKSKFHSNSRQWNSIINEIDSVKQGLWGYSLSQYIRSVSLLWTHGVEKESTGDVLQALIDHHKAIIVIAEVIPRHPNFSAAQEMNSIDFQEYQKFKNLARERLPWVEAQHYKFKSQFEKTSTDIYAEVDDTKNKYSIPRKPSSSSNLSSVSGRGSIDSASSTIQNTYRYLESAAQSEIGLLNKLEKVTGIIEPDLLYELLQNSAKISILFLDVRSATEYQKSRLCERNIVNIDPIIIRPGCTALHIQDALVLSPPQEQKLFQTKGLFDLVIYYDWDSKSRTYILREFCNAIFSPVDWKSPLKRKPILLKGGLQAWHAFLSAERKSISKDLPVSMEVELPVDKRSDYLLNEEEVEWLRSLKAKTDLISNEQPNRDIKKVHRNTAIFSRSMDGNYNFKPPYKETDERPQLNVQQQVKDYSEHEAQERRPTLPDVSAETRMQSQTQNGTQNVPAIKMQPKMEQFYQHQWPQQRQGTAAFISQSTSSIPTESAISRMSSTSSLSTVPSSQTAVRQGSPPPLTFIPGTTIPQTTAIDPRLLKLPERLGYVGLQNLGNSCFMNSVVQNLVTIPELSNYFLLGIYYRDLNLRNPLGSKGYLAETWADLLREMQTAHASYMRPYKLRTVVGKIQSSFQMHEQQDAQEFLAFLLDGLHEDVNKSANNEPLGDIDINKNAGPRKDSLNKADLGALASQEWNRYIYRSWSVVVRLFQGQYMSRLVCMTCKTQSHTFSPVCYLSLPVPAKHQCKLEDCLKAFTAEELLSGDNAWLCPTCKTFRKTKKSIQISLLPEILIVYLKRFHADSRGRRKLETSVTFPCENFRIPDVMPHADGSKFDCQYDLIGIVNHFGSMESGHYIAQVRRGNRWFNCDDSVVSEISQHSFNSKAAYILMYRMRR